MSIPWVSAQLGLNGKFFVPRLLHRNGRLAAMAVPLWYDEKHFAYKLLKRAYWNTLSFFHPELEGFPVHTFLGSKIRFEIKNWRRRKTSDLWGWIDLSNRRYERDLLAWLKSPAFASVRNGPPGVFISWSDISLEAIRFFHEIGWKTVTMQLNCGKLEESLIADESDRYPDMAEESFRAVPGFHERTFQEYRETDHIISNSDWGRGYLLSNGIPAGKISLVPFADEGSVECETARSFPEHFSKDRRLQVLNIGQMSLRKGMGRFFEAIDHMSEWPVEFTFAGAVNIRVPSRIAANPKVRVLGIVPLNKVQQLYRESDLFLFPTLSDAFGLTQLECMAWKLPLVASRHCGDVIQPGVNGLRLDSVTAETICQAVQHFLANPADLTRFSAACRIPAECSLEYFGQALLRIESLLYPRQVGR